MQQQHVASTTPAATAAASSAAVKPKRPPNTSRLGGGMAGGSNSVSGNSRRKTAGEGTSKNDPIVIIDDDNAANDDSAAPASVSSKSAVASQGPYAFPSAGVASGVLSAPFPSSSASASASAPTSSFTPPAAAAAFRSTRQGSSISNPHELPMKYPIADLSRIRPELAALGLYSPEDSIANLIPNGHRTATTRQPPPGVKVGDYVVFASSTKRNRNRNGSNTSSNIIEGVYRIVGFEKVDLSTDEGVERWSQREGWSRAAAFSFGSQVSTGRTQMLFERVEQ